MVELKINEKRLWNSHIELSKIGATPGGGVCRLALTHLDKDARNLFIEWCKEVTKWGTYLPEERDVTQNARLY
jgi:hypothetical protein